MPLPMRETNSRVTVMSSGVSTSAGITSASVVVLSGPMGASKDTVLSRLRRHQYQ